MRDHGTCCVILPLKLGVGIACMLVFASSMVCVLALLTTDVRFQATGYNQHFHRVPEIVGSFGVVFGFVGLLGTYDDRWDQLWWFNRYCFVKIAVACVSVLADFLALGGCEAWKYSPDRGSNPQLAAISEQGVCVWARWSYLVGCSMDLGAWMYLYFNCCRFEAQMRCSPGYAIDFGAEKYDSDSRWQFYKVKDPRRDRPLEPAADQEEEDPFNFYGAVQQEEVGRYGPDGMRVRQQAPSGLGSFDQAERPPLR